MNTALLQNDVQDYLEKHYREDISALALKGSPFPDVSPQELAVQLTGKRKAEEKIPGWFKTRGIVYPPKLNLEQTSSELTANYKASIIEGTTLADITGGLGIDTHSFSKIFSQVVHCEINPELSELAAHNFKMLGAHTISTWNKDGIAFLQEHPEQFDWIFIDPSRRDKSGGRVFLLSDCVPEVPRHLDLLRKKGRNILIKSSPLLDLQAGMRELGSVQEIHIVAVENEVKEVLWMLKEDPTEKTKVVTRNFTKNGVQSFENTFGEEGPAAYSPPLTYLYEPNAAIMKSGLFNSLGNDLSLFKLHPNTHLYSSKDLIDFPGRRFKILEVFPYKKKKLRSLMNLEKAHITTRNFPERVETLRKQLKIKDGGNTYLFFTTDSANLKQVVMCEKIAS